VCLLFELAKQGEVVLLSPACASFDCFKNYEERGDFFKKIVKELTYENSLYISKKKTIQT
jgi:UDP-N-acetylmuramoylalanine--D-glutamate ligase